MATNDDWSFQLQASMLQQTQIKKSVKRSFSVFLSIQDIQMHFLCFTIQKIICSSDHVMHFKKQKNFGSLNTEIL
jgi:hypothetical protein